MSFITMDSNFDWSTGVGGLANYTISVTENIVGGSGQGANVVPLTIDFPSNVTLQFEGGSFDGVTIDGDNTRIIAPIEKIFEQTVTLTGTFVYDTFYPEWYGAVGDGITNDVAAFSLTCLIANHVTLTSNYSISKDTQVIVNRAGSFTLIGKNGSSITNYVTTEYLIRPVFEFENLDNLTIKGVTIDGNLRMANAVYINDIDNVILEDITISNLSYSAGAERTVAIRIDINNPSRVYGNNVKINNIRGGQNTTIGDPLGVARALYCRVDHVDVINGPRGTKVTFENSTFEWAYGDDGDLIDIIDENYISDAAHRFIFRNCDIRYASRRLVKGSASGIQYYNCRFDTASEAELRVVMGATIDITPSGGVNFRNADPTNQGSFRNMHGRMIDCEYRNSGKLVVYDDDTDVPDDTGTGEGGKLVAAYTDGLEIRGCRFYDMYVDFINATANATINNNLFYNSRIQLNVDQNEWEDGISYIMNNEGFFNAENTNHYALINSDNFLIRISICDNNVLSNEDGIDTTPFFGLIRHVTAGNASNVDVFRNAVYRINPVRTSLFISYRTWDATCRVVNNTNNALGAAARYLFPNAISSGGDNFDMNGFSSGNIDGLGNSID